MDNEMTLFISLLRLMSYVNDLTYDVKSEVYILLDCQQLNQK